MFRKRKERLLDTAQKLQCVALGSTLPENVFYTTCFWGDGIVIIDQNSTTLYTNPMEVNRAANYAKDCDIRTVKVGQDLIKEVAKHISTNAKICFDDVSSLLKEKIRKELGDRVVFDPNTFYSVRRIKNQEEIEAMTRCGKLVDCLYEHARSILRPGMREREIAAQLLAKAVDSGASLPSYPSTLNPFIIASGPNSAFPHAELTNRMLCIGDTVVMDLTLRLLGYVIDATRTFVIGRADKEVEKIYEIVRSVQELGIEMARPGLAAGDIDKAVREAIDKEGYGKLFPHGTGHGVGLEVHEPPRVSIGVKELLQKNEVITIEPGIYLKNKFGIRIEDTLLVSKRPRTFTKFPKGIIKVS